MYYCVSFLLKSKRKKFCFYFLKNSHSKIYINLTAFFSLYNLLTREISFRDFTLGRVYFAVMKVSWVLKSPPPPRSTAASLPLVRRGGVRHVLAAPPAAARHGLRVPTACLHRLLWHFEARAVSTCPIAFLYTLVNRYSHIQVCFCLFQ